MALQLSTHLASEVRRARASMLLPDDRVRFSISPHLNHHHANEHAITEYLWFEQHLKGAAFKMPQTPQMVLELKFGVKVMVVMGMKQDL